MAVNSQDDSNARLVIVSRRLSINGAFNLSGNCVRRELADNDTGDNAAVSRCRAGWRGFYKRTSVNDYIRTVQTELSGIN